MDGITAFKVCDATRKERHIVAAARSVISLKKQGLLNTVVDNVSLDQTSGVVTTVDADTANRIFMQQLHLPQNLLTIIADPSTNSPPIDPIAMQLMTDYEEHDGTNQEQEMAQLITVVPTIDLQEPTCSKYLDDGKSASSNDNVTDENQSPNKRAHQTEVQKSCKKQATSVMKFRSFEVNWEKVSDNLLDRLNSLQEYRAKNSTAVPRSMRFKKTELICLVNSVVDQMRCIDTRIRADVMETVAQQILRKYPCLEILDDDGFSNGLSHITIKQKMINRNTYLNRIDNDVPKVKQLTEEFRNRRAGTMKEYWNVSTNQCSKEILSKLRRDEPALLTAEFLMASQGFVRSRLDQKKDLSSIVSEFPVLRRRQLLSFHFKQATGIEIDMLRKYYDSKKAKIVGYSATQKTHALCETSTDYDVFTFLAKLLDENLDGLVLKKEIGTRIDEFRDEIAGPLLLCIVCAAVKITSLKVPSTYLLDKNSKNPDPLILDCEYDVDENEKGFVLKWFLDGQPVYQWIPTKNPFPFQSFKNRVDTSYVVSQERLHKHRAMAIIKPLANFTGEYACMVQTFASIDRKSAKLKIIVQESKFDLNYYLNGDGYITVDCHARDISPEPELQIRINDKIFETPKPRSVLGENNLYNVSISGSIPKEELESPTMIECYLTVPETNYTKKRSTIYYESHLRTTTSTVATTTIVGMLQAAPENLQKKAESDTVIAEGSQHELNATDGNSATALPDQMRTTSGLIVTLVTILLIFTSTLL